MTFDIDIADLPRNVRLCCVLFSVKRRRSVSILRVQTITFSELLLYFSLTYSVIIQKIDTYSTCIQFDKSKKFTLFSSKFILLKNA